MKMTRVGSVALTAVLFFVSPPAWAQTKDAPRLERITVDPCGAEKFLKLHGTNARQQLLVTGHYADGSVRDLTHAARYQPEDAKLLRVDAAVVYALGEGSSKLRVAVDAHAVDVTVHAVDFAKPQPFSFRNEVMAVLSRAGCNMGTCHGNLNGKNGFRLSLRGDSAAFDFDSFSRDMQGRRINRHDPDQSLALLKATGQIAHEGGVRFSEDSVEYGLLRKWIADGAKPDPAGTLTIQELAVWPRERFLWHGAQEQQLVVRARANDGIWRDVTHLAVFDPSSELITVSPSGLVRGHKSGEANVLVRYLNQRAPVQFAFVPPRPEFRWPNPSVNNFIDTHVHARLKSLLVEPSDLADDATFLRRVTLDVCGVLPTPDEARRFLTDPSPDKREKVIDQLLARPEYAELWAMKWSDLLRNEEKAVDAKGVRLFSEWLRQNFAKDVPLDRFVSELVMGMGSTYAKPQANYYRTNLEPTKAAETTAMLFMGVRVACAKCHNHPFDRWTQEDYYGLSAFFARVKTKMVDNKRRDKLDKHEMVGEMIVYLDKAGEVPHPFTNKPMAPRLPGGLMPPIKGNDNRLAPLAAWMTAKENPFFARAMANRVWYHLMGRGIVDPPDDFRESNPASNEPLLAALAKELVDHDFSQKRLIRTILLSRAYQMSYRPKATNEEDLNYSRVVPQRMQAELLLDAVSQVTQVPEPFAGHPLGTRAVQLPGVAGATVFLKAFGRPERLLACECERSGDATLQQALIMINNAGLTKKVEESPRVQRWLKTKASDKAIAEELYLAAFSRFPTEPEAAIVRRHLASTVDRRRGLEDLLWAAVNAKEFLLRR